MNYKKIDLNGSWSISYSCDGNKFKSSVDLINIGAQILPARVPGNFELDLQRVGKISDPFYGMNMLEVNKLENCHVYYFRSFNAHKIPETDPVLIFEGLDTFADVYLNGCWVTSCSNMLVEHKIPIGKFMKDGKNEIFIHIRPAVAEAEKQEYPNFLASGNESIWVRKAPHMYGWDIMPRAVSAGIWRPVFIEFQPYERFDTLYLETVMLSKDYSEAQLHLNYSTTLPSSATASQIEICIEGNCGNSKFFACEKLHFPRSGQIRLGVENPKLWWPRGSGLPQLYDVKIYLKKDGIKIDERNLRFGIRFVELLRTSLTSWDGEGEFLFKINHENIFMKGSNWVPLDAFHSRDAERLEKALEMVADLECNILRCWGGNVYESDSFYELCDEYGICVWQDFAMACHLYPQNEKFQKIIAEEAQKVIERLRQHACLIVWAGDNECDFAYKQLNMGDPNLNVLTRKILPDLLREADPHRPFLPSSPYMDCKAYQDYIKPGKTSQCLLPEDHLWGPRDCFKSDFYRNSVCHFASEIGYHGCPSPESIKKFISPEKIWPWKKNKEWTLHSSCAFSGFFGAGRDDYRVELMAKQIKEFFGEVPDNLTDFAFASQSVQAEADKFFIEMFRMNKWRRTGIIWWNLLDGWPQFSDAVVDYYFNKKLAYNYIKRSQRHVCLMLKEYKNWQHELIACNDQRVEAVVKYTVKDVETEEVLLSGEKRIPQNSVSVVGNIPASMGDKRCLLIEFKNDSEYAWNHYISGNPPFKLDQYKNWQKKIVAILKQQNQD